MPVAPHASPARSGRAARRASCSRGGQLHSTPSTKRVTAARPSPRFSGRPRVYPRRADRVNLYPIVNNKSLLPYDITHQIVRARRCLCTFCRRSARTEDGGNWSLSQPSAVAPPASQDCCCWRPSPLLQLFYLGLIARGFALYWVHLCPLMPNLRLQLEQPVESTVRSATPLSALASWPSHQDHGCATHSCQAAEPLRA